MLGDGPSAMAVAVLAGAATGCDWLWLLARGAEVDADALGGLMAHTEAGDALGDPVLFAAKPVGHDGRLDPAAAPVLRILARELAIAGTTQRLAVLRAVRYGSLLVHRRAIERHGIPRVDFAGGGDDLDWTGRILRDDSGYLVQSSVVRHPGGVRRDPRVLARNRVRTCAGAGCTVRASVGGLHAGPGPERPRSGPRRLRPDADAAPGCLERLLQPR